MIAIIPAAGKGKRIRPKVAGSKEMRKWLGVPGIEYALREAEEVAKEIILILHPEKHDLNTYIAKRSNKIPVRMVYQLERTGLGDALLAAVPYVPLDSNIIVIIPDEVFPYENASKLVVTPGHSVCVKRVTKKNMPRYGMIKPNKLRHEIVDIIEKPTSFLESPSTLSIAGRYYLPAAFLSLLKLDPLDPNQEHDLTRALKNLLPLKYVEIKSKRVDLGKL